MGTMTKDYDYLLKVLLVGDSDVGKHEILSNLEDPSTESPFCSGNGECWLCPSIDNPSAIQSNRLHVSYPSNGSLQDDHHPAGGQAREAAAVGHLRPGTLLHDHPILFAGRSGHHPRLRHHQQVELRRHRSMAQGGRRGQLGFIGEKLFRQDIR